MTRVINRHQDHSCIVACTNDAFHWAREMVFVTFENSLLGVSQLSACSIGHCDNIMTATIDTIELFLIFPLFFVSGPCDRLAGHLVSF